MNEEEIEGEEKFSEIEQIRANVYAGVHNMTMISKQLSESSQCLHNIEETLEEIKQNQKRSKLIPIVLSLILIVLLIK